MVLFIINKHNERSSWITKGRLDLAVLFTPSTPNRQNRNQVRWNICAGLRRSTPSFEVVQTEQSRDLLQKRWRIIACMCGNILYRLIYSGVRFRVISAHKKIGPCQFRPMSISAHSNFGTYIFSTWISVKETKII